MGGQLRLKRVHSKWMQRNTCAGRRSDDKQPLINEDVDVVTPQPIIPRLSKTEVDKAKLSEVSPIVIQHYEGPKKPLPPKTEDHHGLPYHIVEQRHKDISKALKADVKWLTDTETATDDDPPVEWYGYMNHLARRKWICIQSYQIHIWAAH